MVNCQEIEKFIAKKHLFKDLLSKTFRSYSFVDGRQLSCILRFIETTNKSKTHIVQVVSVLFLFTRPV